MNQRIKELALQAGAGEWGDSVVPAMMDIEKFAELIVRECAQIGELKEQDHADYDPDMSVGWYMRQHFGVEE